MHRHEPDGRDQTQMPARSRPGRVLPAYRPCTGSGRIGGPDALGGGGGVRQVPLQVVDALVERDGDAATGAVADGGDGRGAGVQAGGEVGGGPATGRELGENVGRRALRRSDRGLRPGIGRAGHHTGGRVLLARPLGATTAARQAGWGAG